MARTGRRRRIFISYRRADSAGHAGRLNDDLTRLLGRRVFMDVADIAPGERFPAALDAALRTCGAVLAVIGPRWVDELHAARHGEDYVRTELALALRQDDVSVIPVLVRGAGLPSAADLPEDLKPLAARQALATRDDRWRDDVRYLARQLRVSLGLRRAPQLIVALGCVAVAAGGGWMLGRERPGPFVRARAHELTKAAAERAATSCERPEKLQGECPVLLRFLPSGAVDDVYYDTGFCEYKGTPFGDCVLTKLARVRIPPFDDYALVEVGLDVRLEADGRVQVTE